MRLGVGAALALALLCHWSTALPQQQRPVDETEPEIRERPHVAILKQINQINNDGSYTYGFEAADGSFRVETRDIHGNVKGKYGYVDEFGETKTVEYQAGRPLGFMPQGHHLPVIPRPSTSGGNVDDEFGTDEDWQSVDADQDGQPDPPRPKDQRNTPIIQTVRPVQPSFIPVNSQQLDRPEVFIQEAAPQQADRRPALPPSPIFIPASSQPARQSQEAFLQAAVSQPERLPPQIFIQQSDRPQGFLPAGTQSFRPAARQQTFIPAQVIQRQQQERDQQFNGPIFPFQLNSPSPGRNLQRPPQSLQGRFVPVAFQPQPLLRE